MTAGYGAHSNTAEDGGKIGPEFTFGITMEKVTDGPILIITTAWGGKSLHTDFRPPSAGPYKLSLFQRDRYPKQQGHGIPKTRATGRYYHLMIDHVKKVLKGIKRACPAYDPEQGYELAGFVWFQGWNDMCDGHTYPSHSKPDRYELCSELLAHFTRDVREDLSAPKLPFAIGVMGVGGGGSIFIAALPLPDAAVDGIGVAAPEAVDGGEAGGAELVDVLGEGHALLDAALPAAEDSLVDFGGVEAEGGCVGGPEARPILGVAGIFLLPHLGAVALPCILHGRVGAGHVVGVEEDPARPQHPGELAVEPCEGVGAQPVQRGGRHHGVHRPAHRLGPRRAAQVGQHNLPPPRERRQAGFGEGQKRGVEVHTHHAAFGQGLEEGVHEAARAAPEVEDACIRALARAHETDEGLDPLVASHEVVALHAIPAVDPGAPVEAAFAEASPHAAQQGFGGLAGGVCGRTTSRGSLCHHALPSVLRRPMATSREDWAVAGSVSG